MRDPQEKLSKVFFRKGILLCFAAVIFGAMITACGKRKNYYIQ